MNDAGARTRRSAEGRNRSIRILNPNGHLGFAPIKTGSFHNGLKGSPDLVAADAGSNDIGPVPLATNVACSPLEWQTHDLREMLLAARVKGVPMIVGSAGDTGANDRVDEFVKIIKDIAKEQGLGSFKLGYFYSEVDADTVRTKMRAGEVIEGLDERPALTEDEPPPTASSPWPACIPISSSWTGAPR